jgi:NADH-quinone oxidoreductase subunit N
VAFIRLFYTGFGNAPATWQYAVSIMAVLTMFAGNITAIFQDNLKRMLAYSSVAHAGYILIALVALSKYSIGGVLYYTLTYSIATIMAFNILYTVSGYKNEGVTTAAFFGLAKRNPLMALGMTVALLSLAAIPPFSGFFAKYYVFTAALHAGRIKLVLLAVVASLISLYYYFKIIIAIYTGTPKEVLHPIEINGIHKFLYIICIVLLLALSVFPEFIINLSL